MASTSPSPPRSPALDVTRQVRYWRRCLKTYLPHFYTSMDSTRTLLACFIVSALDLLDALDDALSPAERADHIAWVYRCQLPTGGFRGSPSHQLVGHCDDSRNDCWDPANVPATYFALATLLVLGDDLRGVHRRDCLDWLRRVQRPDGSFGELLGEDGEVEGKADPRMAYCAMNIRWMLGGGLVGDVEDVRVDDLVRWLQTLEDWGIPDGGQTYDGGIAGSPFGEAHAGYAHCVISILALVDRLPYGVANPLPQPIAHRESPPQHPRQWNSPTALRDLQLTLHWLVFCQTTYVDEDAPPPDALDPATMTPTQMSGWETQSALHESLQSGGSDTSQLTAAMTPCAGFNGRCNKLADTCYAFWVYGALHTLGQTALPSLPAAREHLLVGAQHPVAGGFGKAPSDAPDLYHSYLALATLGVVGEAGVKRVDPVLCFAEGVRERVFECWQRWTAGDG